MFAKTYNNFVRASSPEPIIAEVPTRTISGKEAQKLYLEEVETAKTLLPRSAKITSALENRRKVVNLIEPIANKDLFTTVQNNDVETLKCVLDHYPDKINVVDDYGWSLLMIACQANSVDAVKLLLKRGVDMSVRDKAGNSARSLVIKNKNYVLADVLLSCKQNVSSIKAKQSEKQVTSTEEFNCEVCNKTFPSREEHLSSTIHNISASKGKKIPTNYVIPTTNRGYQLMLKGGWDKESGLGRDGTGKKYPIKTVQKKDRKGLGHEKPKCDQKSNNIEDKVKHKNRKMFSRDYRSNKSFEINFRREFY